MEFDDYNYTNYNDFILLTEPEGGNKQKIINDRKKLFLEGMQHDSESDDNDAQGFNAENLERHSTKNKYEHDILRLEPLEYEHPDDLASP